MNATTESGIRRPTAWIRLTPTGIGIVATCLHCQGTRTFRTVPPDEVYLDEIVEAMTDHVMKNHT